MKNIPVIGCFLAWLMVVIIVCVAVERGPKKTENLSSFSRYCLYEISIDITSYIAANHGRLPSLNSVTRLATAVGGNPSTKPFIDPTNNAPFSTNPYFSDVILTSIKDPQLVALLYDSGQGPKHIRSVLFANLHVRWVMPAEWEKIKRYSHIK